MQNDTGYPVPSFPKKRRRWPFVIIGLVAAALIGAAVYFILDRRPAVPSEPTQNQAPVAQDPPTEEAEPQIEPLPSVQKTVDKWLAANSGEYGIVIHDVVTGKSLAAAGGDTSFFAASIYKLYVAYLGYIDIQEGKHALEEPFLGEWTRGECLDKMIRESHSPCAEKLWAEQGKESSTRRLKAFGFTGTSMVSLTTTAHDSNLILVRLGQSKDLNEKHTALLRKSMDKQIYRDVIPKALPGLKVGDKVGFRELVEYHDVGLVTLPDDRLVAISILTRNAGTRRMANLTAAAFAPLLAAVQE